MRGELGTAYFSVRLGVLFGSTAIEVGYGTEFQRTRPCIC